LEEELKEVQLEIERIEKDPYGYTGVGIIGRSPHKYGEGGDDEADRSAGVVDDGDGWDHRFSYLPVQHTRLQSQPQNQIPSQVLGPVGRPSLPPIQRPSSSHVYTSTGSGSPSIRPHRHSLEPPFVYQPPTQAQTQTQTHTPTHTQSQSQSGIKSPQRIPTVSTSSSPSSSLAAGPAITILSSKATPFEPSRGVSHTVRSSFPPSTAGAGFSSGVGIGGIPGSSPPMLRPSGSVSRKSFTRWGNTDSQAK